MGRCLPVGMRVRGEAGIRIGGAGVRGATLSPGLTSNTVAPLIPVSPDGRPMRIANVLLLAAALGLPFLAGCAADESSDGATMRIDTVAGIPRVTNEGDGVWRDGEAWRIGEDGVLIGGVEGDDAYVFGDIAGLGVAADGTIYVADGQAKEVRAFSPDGAFRARFGRSGEGPGEFRAIDALVVARDGTVIVRDPQGFRITRFGPDGTYRSSFRLQRPFMQFAGSTTLTIADDGRLFDQLQFSIGAGSADSLGVIVYAADGTPADSIVLMVYQPETVVLTRDSRAVMGLQVPFTPRPSTAVARDGTIAWGIGASFSFDVADANGDTLRTVARNVEPEAVSAAERDSATAVMRTMAEENAGVKQLPDFDFPAHKPAYRQIVADAAGNWWVGSGATYGTAPEHARYDVFEAGGRYLGAVDVPSLRILQIGEDFVAGVRTDSLGVPYAAVLPLIKPSKR